MRTCALSGFVGALVERALREAKRLGPFAGTGNENGNGKALAGVSEGFLAHAEVAP